MVNYALDRPTRPPDERLSLSDQDLLHKLDDLSIYTLFEWTTISDMAIKDLCNRNVIDVVQRIKLHMTRDFARKRLANVMRTHYVTPNELLVIFNVVVRGYSIPCTYMEFSIISTLITGGLRINRGPLKLERDTERNLSRTLSRVHLSLGVHPAGAGEPMEACHDQLN